MKFNIIEELKENEKIINLLKSKKINYLTKKRKY